MSEKTALITGVTGQTGSYLAELLLAKHYAVAGLKRRHAAYNPRNLATCFNYPETFTLIDGDMTDESSLRAIIEAVQPDEIYNMAAMSFVAESWNTPISTNDVNYLGFIKLLEAVRAIKPNTKVYQASSSEMFGNQPPPQHEMTRMTPRSPYGVSKVTRKIAVGLAARAIYAGNPKIKLGYLDSKRDWGYAPDYARAMWMMLQRGAADDWVIATGETHSVREYLQLAFEASGLSGQVEDHVEIDESLYRPAEVFELRGDPSRANKILEWEPEVNFKQLVEIMVTSELKLQTPL
jgi:GDPmannose 4,6-dehydratase